MNSLMSGKFKLFIIFFALLLIVVSGLYVHQKFFGGNIKLEVNVFEDVVEVGVPFDVEISFTNNSQNVLSDVRLTLNLPEDLIRADGKEGIITRELEDISTGVTHRELFQLIATPSREPNYNIETTVFYSTTYLTAEFRRTTHYDIGVRESGLELSLTLPESVFPGETFDILMEYRGLDDIPEGLGLKLSLNYPDFISIVDADTGFSNGAWQIGGAQNKEGSGVVRARGKLDVSAGGYVEVGGVLLMRILDNYYPLVRVVQKIEIAPSPLSFSVVLDERGDIVYPGDKLTYSLLYKNNTEVDLRDIVIHAQLIGEMFDEETLVTDAVFNSLTNTITWSAGRFEKLRSVGGGKRGSVSFSIGVNDSHPISKLNDKNFTLRLESKIESPTVPYLIDVAKTTNVATHEARVAGKVSVDAEIFFRDAKMGVVNAGPFPPITGRPTNYTIHWRVTNFGTDVSDVVVRARLKDGVTFVRAVEGSTESLPQFNVLDGGVVWEIGRLTATTGVLGEGPSAVFQIEAIPGVNRVGEYMPLVGVSEISGTDEFTGVVLTSTSDVLTTELPNDPTIEGGDGIVR